MNLMKSLKVLVTIVCVALIIAGCVMRDYPPVYDLPEDAKSYELIYNEDTGATLIELNGRTYSLFGKLKGSESDDYVMECLGFVGNDENVRIYSLTDDASLNYIMVFKIDGSANTPDFYRALDTWQEDILTPSYIEPLGTESWGSAGLIHYDE